MPRNNINDLGNHLFDVIERLKDPDPEEKNPMTIERARAISDAAKVIIESAKAEIDLLGALGCTETAATTGFFGVPEESRELPERFAAGNGRPTALPAHRSGQRALPAAKGW